MNNKKLDKQIAIVIEEETNSASELKDETWNKINKELFPSRSHSKTRRKSAKGIVSGLVAAAIVAFIFFGMTDSGQAMIQSLKDMFVEEKQQEIEIEGMKEETNVHLETNEELRYIIYIDDYFYKMEKGDISDRIVPKEDLPEKYPEVSVEIMHKEGTTTEEMVETIKQVLENEGMEVNQEESINTPITGVVVKGIGEAYTNEQGKTGHQWDTPIHRYYITEAEDSQLFVIKQKYFLEAAEGHGARFIHMMESFEIVK